MSLMAAIMGLNRHKHVDVCTAQVETAGNETLRDAHAKLQGLLDECGIIDFEGPAVDTAVEAMKAFSSQTVRMLNSIGCHGIRTACLYMAVSPMWLKGRA